MGEHRRERGMGAAFVKIGARYINLSAILWVEVQEEKPKQRLMLVYHTFQDGHCEQLTLEGDEATQLRDILHNIKRNEPTRLLDMGLWCEKLPGYVHATREREKADGGDTLSLKSLDMLVNVG